MWESRTFKNFPDVRTMQGRLRFLKGAPPNQPGQGSTAETWNEVSFVTQEHSDPVTRFRVCIVKPELHSTDLKILHHFHCEVILHTLMVIYFTSVICVRYAQCLLKITVMFEFVKVMPLFSGHIFSMQSERESKSMAVHIHYSTLAFDSVHNGHLNFKSWKDNKILSEVVLMTYDKICKLYTVAWMNVIPRA